MTAADVDAAADVIVRGGWGDRRAFFRFAVGHPDCDPIVAEADGAVIGTGLGTRHGSVGWIGTIFVDPAWRGRGLGRRLTEAAIDGLEAAGCRTLLLVATEAGRRLYEKLGFEVQTTIRILEAAARPTGPGRPLVRRFGAGDLEPAMWLDRAATGEDRSALLRAFSGGGWTLAEDGRVRGFALHAVFGGWALVAADPDAAVGLLDHRRAIAAADRPVRTGLFEDNQDGIARLLADGWSEAWAAPRMVRGAPLEWRPDAIWGQFSHAMG